MAQCVISIRGDPPSGAKPPPLPDHAAGQGPSCGGEWLRASFGFGESALQAMKAACNNNTLALMINHQRQIICVVDGCEVSKHFSGSNNL